MWARVEAVRFVVCVVCVKVSTLLCVLPWKPCVCVLVCVDVHRVCLCVAEMCLHLGVAM